MSPISKKWFENAIHEGIDPQIAYFGAEVIDSWSQFWRHDISEDNLSEMIRFAKKCPEAALYRWSNIAGPRPWIPEMSLYDILKSNPKYSPLDKEK